MRLKDQSAIVTGAASGFGAAIAERFAAADTNHDGKLTLAEAEAGMPRVAANFSKIDADGSGTVTLAEIEALADR
jgi:NAD(P)-dependent dehydrogenase (short-subunit alcohol dehydrogenase family)